MNSCSTLSKEISFQLKTNYDCQVVEICNGQHTSNHDTKCDSQTVVRSRYLREKIETVFNHFGKIDIVIHNERENITKENFFAFHEGENLREFMNVSHVSMSY